MTNRSLRFMAILFSLFLGLSTATAWSAPARIKRFMPMAQGPNDIAIEIQIKSLYDLDNRINLEDLQVHSRAGVVNLRGTVLTDYERSTAEHLAGTVQGVRSLINEIKVVPPLNADFAIMKAVREDIIQNPTLKISKFKTEVQGGTAYLYGLVKDPKQKEKAAQIVKGIPGIQALENRIMIQQG